MATQSGRILLGALDRMVYSSANYWVVMLSDLAAALIFLALGLNRFSGPWVVGGGVAIMGFMFSGLLEYIVHRWLLHGPPSMARRGHAHHHAEPRALISTPLGVATDASGNVYVADTANNVVRRVSREGVIAKKGIEIPLERINTIFFQQGIFERLMGLGDLEIESASKDGAQMFDDIRKPSAVQNEIYRQMEINSNRQADRVSEGIGQHLNNLPQMQPQQNATDEETVGQGIWPTDE